MGKDLSRSSVSGVPRANQVGLFGLSCGHDLRRGKRPALRKHRLVLGNGGGLLSPSVLLVTLGGRVCAGVGRGFSTRGDIKVLNFVAV